MTNIQIANTILAQLGGNKFRAMTGAKDFIAIDRGLQFGLPARFARDGINKVRVTLTPADTYDVEYMACTSRLGVHKARTIAKDEGVYCDMLQEGFKRATGLDTRLF